MSVAAQTNDLGSDCNFNDLHVILAACCNLACFYFCPHVCRKVLCDVIMMIVNNSQNQLGYFFRIF